MESEKYGLVLALGLSLLLFGWMSLLVGAPTPATKLPPPPPKPPPPPAAKNLSELFLDPLTNFPLGGASANHDQFESLKTQLVEKGAGEGDILLLLGSADCTSKRDGDNEDLARERAQTVRQDLESLGLGKAHGVKIRTYVLPQYAGCRADANMRGVYPLLIRSVSSVR
jgi:hypothetical protein